MWYFRQTLNHLCQGGRPPSSTTTFMSLLLSSWTPFCNTGATTRLEESHTRSSESSGTQSITSVAGSTKKHSKGQEISLLVAEVLLQLGFAVTLGLLTRYLIDKVTQSMSQDGGAPPPNSSQIYQKLHKILSKRHQNRHSTTDDRKDLQLSSYELQVAEAILDPETDISTSFADMGGITEIKQEIYDLSILPLLHPDLFQGKLVEPCKGILLYGKPGVGKTMLAKALAKEAQAVFVPLQLSAILNKWVGESNKLVAAAFSLAHKVQPAVLFIDELDTFLKSSNADNAYLDTIKSEFLTLWDGISTSQQSQVLVLGATNKPQSIDPAILRRMPRTFHVPLPDAQGRQEILQLLLKDEDIDTSGRRFVEQELATKLTVGYSGSDLKELCKAAAMVRVRERTHEFSRQRVKGERVDLRKERESLTKHPLRAMSKRDFVLARSKVGPTGAAAHQYGKEHEAEERERASSQVPSLDARALQQMMAQLLQSISSGDEVPLPNYEEIPNLN